MHYCDGCHLPITNIDTEERNRWCQSIRGILKLGEAQPEDYHEKCFVDVLMRQNKQAAPQPTMAGPFVPPGQDLLPGSFDVRGR